MSDKRRAAYHGAPPVVAVHLAVLYEAVCHSCGWESGPLPMEGDAEHAANGHTVCRTPR